MKAMFTLTIFEIFLFEGRSVLRPAQRITVSERVKCTKILTIVGILISFHITLFMKMI